MCTDLRDPKCDRKDWFLTYAEHHYEKDKPRTRAYLICRCNLKEEVVSVPGSLSFCQLVSLFGCSKLNR